MITKFEKFLEGLYTSSDGKFWGSVGAGVLAITKDSKKILIGLRGAQVNEPFTWGVIGGKLDDGETDVKDAAKREFLEETGYSGNIEMIPAYVFTSSNGSFTYHNFIGLIESEFKPNLDWETSQARWVTLNELLRLPHKHFGLEGLIKNSLDIIRPHCQ